MYLLSMNINSILRVFAYICIWTTPLQVACVFWGIGIIVVTDFTLLSLTNIEFLRNYLAFFLPIIEWLYTWFWNTLLDWIFSLPMILHQTLKALVSTWLGFFILRNIKK